MKKLLKSKKALSPVVAAIILIAVTVAVSIAVAVWMGSLSFNFMQTEQIQITQVSFDTTTNDITIRVQNTGTVDVTIISATVTGSGVTSTDDLTANEIFDADGTNTSMVIHVQGTLSAGSLYNVELLSAKGNKFTYTETA